MLIEMRTREFFPENKRLIYMRDTYRSFMNQLDPNHCPLDELAAWVTSIDENHDPEWHHRIIDLFHQMNDRLHLETLGKAVTAQQALAIIRSCLRANVIEQSKLTPLLAGLQELTFRQMLSEAKNAEMQVMKRESLTEQVQHLLTLFISEMGNIIRDYTVAITALEKDIDVLSIDELSKEEVLTLFERIDAVSHLFSQALEQTNQALALSWNTMRLDLIEKLNAIKDVFYKFSALVIGHPRAAERSPRGLYAKLEEKLFLVYGNPTNPMEIVRDDEPAFNSLSKLSIWYVQDYWDIGLLPGIKNPQLLPEKDLSKNRENLIQEAKNNLEKTGLKTVKDLKEALIFSKATLKEFIDKALLKHR